MPDTKPLHVIALLPREIGPLLTRGQRVFQRIIAALRAKNAKG